ncbi:hypothetical protein JRO89_XS04G0063100 [Xanthoceras sorbifolium]|uniref:Retrovirus-related Pol polyprotein from transposon TNT 1-94-like beta-barrel domain-containing protein n=1 Tax=Xanthoceras sorbifolium TaxID=99658 RepID=A0ABQ8I4Y4_9ROSI|nr:hypothetical protein JRO89_XS04G0063100 [Xanthoceras sorbifolium]
MCGDKRVLSDLDESFCNTVKFGDNSTVFVMGKGNVTLQTKENSTHTISNVLFVPDLKTNLLSVGQLQEKGYEISIKDKVCEGQQHVRNQQQAVPAVPVTENVPTNSQSPPITIIDEEGEQRLQRARKRPAWMIDYEVSDTDDYED